MREPAFWWQTPGLRSALLAPVSLLYGALAGARMQRQGARIGVPVICIGNFTLGGTGKTPTAIAVARQLARMGEQPFFLTRGYGGRLAGPVRVDAAAHSSADVGDEPLLLARHAPTVVARDRAAGAALATRESASVIVMDDGLQNPSLQKDLSLCVADARRGFGNARVFPAGPLRAPVSQQFASVRAVLLIGEGPGEAQVLELARRHRCEVLHARLEPAAAAIDEIARRKVFAFAGIGDPQKFFLTLASAGIEVAARQSFPDHHPYSEEDARRILARCEQENLIPLTTEKDLVRLAGANGMRARLAASARALPVSLVHDEALSALLRNVLAQHTVP